ncbi:DUF4334 domain-containing protein [Bdellovibrio sp. SKB1291214]|uniref:DUF4334 domain-containing protein n=1 Tax=Bdellovibrio sp. SKB1291214 TaxID=1732569 RepID=UPI000B5164BF|nr:DUF4334 domain-containing protein [Bdellovibrio sp. SKB1291214]UYL07749.1 DUF4334 domain-containing protein [Bdellovibrio sp. SKB1291214]
MFKIVHYNSLFVTSCFRQIYTASDLNDLFCFCLLSVSVEKPLSFYFNGTVLGRLTVKTSEQILLDKIATTEEILALFDSLPPADLDFLNGRWKGFEVKTEHPLDGLLENSGWYGKLFKDTNDVHPLLFYSHDKQSVFAIDPLLVPLCISEYVPRSKSLQQFVSLAKPVIQTKTPKARTRLIQYRGKLTASMIYDAKPIIDHFAKLDEKHLLGIMDLKGSQKPYAFILERDDLSLEIEL